MRMIVVSDTHGAASRLNRVLQQRQKEADVFLHLGDGAAKWLAAQKKYPDLTMKLTAGNCDFAYCSLPHELIWDEQGYSIFATHGDLYQVKFGLDRILQRAKEIPASILLYGHTHQSFTDYQDGIYIFNPGSLGRPADGVPSYGIVDITKAGVVCHLIQKQQP